MEKLIIIDDDWEECILNRKDNPFAFDSIIEQKCSKVNKILLPDEETGWMMSIKSSKIILIN
jgi:hypothetical protein